MQYTFKSYQKLIVLGLILASACSPSPTPEPATSTPLAASSTPGPQSISFTTPDNAAVGGRLYGSGSTAVIFSVMGNCRQGWEQMAERVSQSGVAALTFQWRGCKESGIVVEEELQLFVDDLRGAINFMRAQGAERIILAGASLGGVASAKLADESQADGLIILASPAEIPEWGFEIVAEDINIDVPKLFITAENDETVAVDRSRALYDLAADPKEWQTYPGTAHGTELFDTDSAEEVEQRILDFISATAASNP
ncbi:MAG TPA: alpha/beta hydrolase [Anaerolineales bacterium]|nr:alpha/beta hydrolase [Anaerolineales bacterium]